MTSEPAELPDDPVRRIRSHAARIGTLRTKLAAEIKARDEAIVDAVDEGLPQDQVAAAAGVGPSRVNAILAGDVDDDGA